MKQAIIIPHQNIAFLHWGQEDILGLHDPQLDVCQKFTDPGQVMHDLGSLVWAAAEIELSGADAVDLEGLFAGHGV